MLSSVLILCVGNVCRSPMAEGLLRDSLPNTRVSSAGTGALIDAPAEPHAVALMAERGIDISSHRARQVSALLCQEAELILVMDHRQKLFVERNYAFSCGRVYRLGQVGDFDVPDPYKGTRENFSSSLDLIEKGVSEWTRRIRSI